MDENLISWNPRNFITVVLMLGIIWVILGTVGHVFFRAPVVAKGKGGNRANIGMTPATLGPAENDAA